MGDSGKGFKFECWRACSSLRFSFLELCPAMDHRLGALGLLGSSGGLFCCENCYSAFWDSVGIPGRCLPTQTHQCSSTVTDPSGGDVVY